MPGGPRLTARVVGTIKRVGARIWDRCAGGGDPFTRYAFLRLLEDSGSVGREAGVLPMHLTLEDGAGSVVAVAPLFSHARSLGTYTSDQGWAQGFARAGLRYYPTLQLDVPFQPVMGRRLLVAPGAEEEAWREALRDAVIRTATNAEVASFHLSYCTEAEQSLFERAGLIPDASFQYHWVNEGYDSFDAYLGVVKKKKRDMIRRERRDALAGGLRVERFAGSECTSRHWDLLYAFQSNTAARKKAPDNLTPAFFHGLGDALGDDAVLVLATDRGEPVAGALYVVGPDVLYVRFWGAKEEMRFVHFECTLYQAIEVAIERGLARIDCGGGGIHKLARGFLPQAMHHVHWVRDSRLRRTLAREVAQKRRFVRDAMEQQRARSPFRP